MAKLGFLGLGIMGYPMARNLSRAGHDLAVWSKTTAKAQQLATETGATALGSPAEVAARSECVFLCVGDTAMSQEVLLGKDGVAEGVTPGTVVADASTVAPSASRFMGEQLTKKGVSFLDAPCTGSKPGAENATLTFMVGGDRDVFNRVKPWFEPMGKNFHYCGGPGMGLQAKLSQNLLLANMMQAFNESIALATKAGVAAELMLDILNNSAAKSGLVAFKAPYIFSRDFSTNFSTKWMHKDVSMALDSGRENGVPLPLTALTQQMFQAAISMGYGEEDFCATVKVLENWTGQEIKK